MIHCNILLLGQTGVGKSALLNYLAGEELADSGVSSTCGGITRGINKYQIDLNGQICSISDSEGLELKYEKEWKRLVDKELFPKSKPKSIASWYHIVLFCIGANSARVQDFELELIDKIIENKYGVIIALTKSDLASEEELDHLQESITNHFGDNSQLIIIPVCSKQRRCNTLEGKEEIASAIINSWEQTLIGKLPEFIFSPVFESLNSWTNHTREWLYSQRIGILHNTKTEVLNKLNEKITKKINEINSNLISRQKRSLNEVSQVNQAIGQVLDFKTLKSMNSSIAPRIDTLESSLVFGEKTGAKIALGMGLTAISVFFPIAGIAASLGLTVKSLFQKSPIEEIDESFVNQYYRLTRLYSEREDMMGYVIADAFGYYYGRREIAIGYLKGRGMEQSDKRFEATIREVEQMIEEYNIEDGRGEYYVSYYYYSKRTKKGDDIGKRWLKKSVSHGYEDAMAVFKFGDVFSLMRTVEIDEETELENYWRS